MVVLNHTVLFSLDVPQNVSFRLKSRNKNEGVEHFFNGIILAKKIKM